MDGATQQKYVAVSRELTLSDNITTMTHHQLNHLQEERPTGQLLIELYRNDLIMSSIYFSTSISCCGKRAVPD